MRSMQVALLAVPWLLMAGCRGATTPQPPPAGSAPQAVVPVPEPAASVAAPVPAPPRGHPCAEQAPPPPALAADSLTLRELTHFKGRLSLFEVEGRTLLVGDRPNETKSFSDGTHRWPVPETRLRNRFFELKDDRIVPAPEVERGMWSDQDIFRMRGRWPAVECWSTNHANTAWETVRFVWLADPKKWDTTQVERSQLWRNGRIGFQNDASSAPEPFWFEPSAEALGLPAALCKDDPACRMGLLTAPSRDIYANPDACKWDDRTGCEVSALLHWCAPLTGFQRVELPRPQQYAQLEAVPGTAVVIGSEHLIVRDGVVQPTEPPEAPLERRRVYPLGGVIWYVGNEGIYQLQATAWRRVVSWKGAVVERDSRKVFQFQPAGQATDFRFVGVAIRGESELLVAGASANGTTLFTTAAR